MRSNLENNLARQLRLFSPSHEILSATLSGSFIVPPDGPTYLFLNPGGATRTVFLPDIPPQGGLLYGVINIGSESLNVVDDLGVAIATVGAGQFGIFTCSFTAWSSLLGLLSTYNDLLASLLSQPRVVTADFVVGSTDTTIAIERSAPTATAGTLPTVASRNGRPVSVVDWSTSISSHIITLTPNGAETIMRESTWTLASNGTDRASVTLWPSTTLNGWYIKP